jgi:hypothetical protein
LSDIGYDNSRTASSEFFMELGLTYQRHSLVFWTLR